MKYALCILAHKEPDLLERLVKKLESANTQIYIHLDKKCRLEPYVSRINPAYFIKERVKVYWGGRSMVLAMKHLMENVLRDGTCDYLLFISGQDYPLVPPDRYDDILDKNYNYLTYEKLPRSGWEGGGLKRISRYYLFNNNEKIYGRFSLKLQKIMGLVRKPHKSIQVFGGSQWININRETARTILGSWRAYYRYFKFTWIPDEMFFQTVIMNSGHGSSTINDNLRHLRFLPGHDNPLVFDHSHYEEIVCSKALFFRKVANNSLLDLIDQFHSGMETEVV